MPKSGRRSPTFGVGTERRMFFIRTTGRENEFGVEPKHLQCERHLVDDALAGRLAFGPKLKIGRPVVVSLAVKMMRRLSWHQRTTKHFFHDKSVFKRLLLRPDADSDVSRSGVNVPIGVAGAPFAVRLSAGLGTKAWGIVKSEQVTILHLEASPFFDRSAPLANKSWRLKDFSATGTLERAKPLVRSAWATLQGIAANNAVHDWIAHINSPVVMSRNRMSLAWFRQRLTILQPTTV